MRSVTAEPAFGSVIPRAITISPVNNLLKYFSFWKSDAYSAKVLSGPKLPDWITSALLGQTKATCSIAKTASISLPP